MFFLFSSFSFAVFALGSTAYPKYCAFGKWLDLALKRLDGNRLVPIGFGDELGDRDGEFNKWAKAVYQKACLEAGLHLEKKKKNILGDAKVARYLVHFEMSKKLFFIYTYYLHFQLKGYFSCLNDFQFSKV